MYGTHSVGPRRRRCIGALHGKGSTVGRRDDSPPAIVVVPLQIYDSRNVVTVRDVVDGFPASSIPAIMDGFRSLVVRGIGCSRCALHVRHDVVAFVAKVKLDSIYSKAFSCRNRVQVMSDDDART